MAKKKNPRGKKPKGNGLSKIAAALGADSNEFRSYVMGNTALQPNVAYDIPWEEEVTSDVGVIGSSLVSHPSGVSEDMLLQAWLKLHTPVAGISAKRQIKGVWKRSDISSLPDDLKIIRPRAVALDDSYFSTSIKVDTLNVMAKKLQKTSKSRLRTENSAGSVVDFIHPLAKRYVLDSHMKKVELANSLVRFCCERAVVDDSKYSFDDLVATHKVMKKDEVEFSQFKDTQDEYALVKAEVFYSHGLRLTDDECKSHIEMGHGPSYYDKFVPQSTDTKVSAAVELSPEDELILEEINSKYAEQSKAVDKNEYQGIRFDSQWSMNTVAAYYHDKKQRELELTFAQHQPVVTTKVVSAYDELQKECKLWEKAKQEHEELMQGLTNKLVSHWSGSVNGKSSQVIEKNVTKALCNTVVHTYYTEVGTVTPVQEFILDVVSNHCWTKPMGLEVVSVEDVKKPSATPVKKEYSAQDNFRFYEKVLSEVESAKKEIAFMVDAAKVSLFGIDYKMSPTSLLLPDAVMSGTSFVFKKSGIFLPAA